MNSSQATRFRQWATRVLRNHLTRQALVTDIGREVVGLILGYAKTWRLLLDYDEGRLTVPASAQPARGVRI